MCSSLFRIAFSDGKPVPTFPENARGPARREDRAGGRGAPNEKPARRGPAGAVRRIAFRQVGVSRNRVKRRVGGGYLRRLKEQRGHRLAGSSRTSAPAF